MRRLTPVLLVAFGLRLAIELVRIFVELGTVGAGIGLRMELAYSGVWDMFMVVAAYGLVDLSQRLTGPAAKTVRVAGLLLVGSLAFETAFQVGLMLDSSTTTLFTIEPYVYWGTGMLAAVGIAVAAWPRSRALAIVGVVLCALSVPPSVFDIDTSLGLDGHAQFLLWQVFNLAYVIGLFVLVIAASDGIEVPRRELATSGFGLAGAALTLRVAAAALGVVLTLAALSAHGAASFTIMRFALIAGLAINFISFAMFGIGAMRASRSAFDGLPRYTAALAGVASLWCAGVMLEQLPQLYQVFYGHRAYGDDAAQRIQALSIAMPIIGTISGAAIGAAIAGLGRARNDFELARRASSAGIGFVVLMLASIGIQSVLVDPGRSEGTALMMMFAAVGCGLAAQLMLSKVCHLASVAIDLEPGLPRATLENH